MSYLPCTDPIAPCPNCPQGQVCIQTGRSNTQCARNICVAGASSTPVTSNPIGSTIGGALGGVLGILAAVGLLYWFWWKPRGLAASRKRYSRHITARQSRLPNGVEKSGSKKDDGTVGRPTSIHLRMDGVGEATLSRRGIGGNGSSSDNDEGLNQSTTAIGGNRTENDNPFGDHNRSSIATDRPISTRTSEFSFRSSTSTNIIPIAYIPPHSNSMSLEDSTRGAYGELQNVELSTGERRNSHEMRYSVPMSIASRDSSELLHDSPTLPPLAVASGGIPTRPIRSPGLDLQLPIPNSAPLSPNYLQGQRPPSGFPWDPPSPSLLNPSSSPRTLRGVSQLQRQPSHLSTYSTMSSSTSRSDGSTLSYILDPPQIITPVNAQGLRRFEVVGRGQAGLVRIVGSGPGSSPNTLAQLSPSTGNSLTPLARTFESQQSSDNPFTDEASAGTRFSVGDVASSQSPILALNDTSLNLRPESSSTYHSLFQDTRSNIDQADENSRHSQISSRSDLSSQYLDGVPFITPRSPLFPNPHGSGDLSSPRNSMISDVGSTTESSYFQDSEQVLPNNFISSDPSSNQESEVQDLSPLPTPYLPFAGQGPNSRVQSQVISVRSGFGSGLSQIPFQLGFPSGLGDGSERGSMISLDSRNLGSESGDQHPNYVDAEVGELRDDPFGEHAEIGKSELK